MKRQPTTTRTRIHTLHEPSWLTQRAPDELILSVYVVPQARGTRVMGLHEGRLKLQLAAEPAHDRANHVLIQFLAEALGVAAVQLSIVGGNTSRNKRVRIAGVPYARALLGLSPRAG